MAAVVVAAVAVMLSAVVVVMMVVISVSLRAAALSLILVAVAVACACLCLLCLNDCSLGHLPVRPSVSKAYEGVHHPSSQDCCDECGDGAYDGERDTHEAECGYYGVYASLRCGYEERCHSTSRRTLFPQRHGCGDNPARAEGERDAEYGGVDDRPKGGL